MIKATGINMARYHDGSEIITLKIAPESLQEASEVYVQVQGLPEIAVELSKPKKRRSMDANAYAWVLMDRLAAKTGVGKIEIYKENIRQIGGNSVALCVQKKAVDEFCETWESNGLGWITDKMESKIDGCTTVIAYYGSSTYDTAQMARLIDRIVQDCKAQGVETMPPKELAGLLEGWGKNGK